MSEDLSITLTLYDKEKLPINFDGFIDPDGYFIKVCDRTSLGGMHDAFAEAYVYLVFNQKIMDVYHNLQEKNQNLKGIMLGPKDILINVYGFVLYEHHLDGVILARPKYFYNGKKVNDRQMETASKLLELNKDDLRAAYQLVSDNFSHFSPEFYQKRL